MKLVEADQTGPFEGEDAVVTPPRPVHRRVSVSLVFTICVLGGLVATIYNVFPARHHALLREAVARHRDAEPTWELVAPSPGLVRAWAIGLVGGDVPLPPASLPVIGVRRAALDATAVVRVRIGDDDVTFVVQHAHGVAPGEELEDGDLRAVEWRVDGYSCVAVGAAASAARWQPVIARARGGS
jgi:hypothetical protein